MPRLWIARVLTVVLFAAPIVASAQVSVGGTVVDGPSGRPMPGATVTAKGVATTTTNDSGQFTLTADQAFTKITVSHAGYVENVVSLAGATQPLRIAMSPLQTLPGVQVVAQHPPSSEGVLTATDLNRFDGLSLVNAINTIPGVLMETRTPWGGAQITIRGYYPNSGGNNPNSNGLGYQVFLNNIPITDATGTTVLDDIDYSSLSNVEVIKGPASSLYGSFIGGTVNLTTAKPEYEGTTVSQQVLSGSYGMLRTNTTLEHAGADGSDFVLDYGHQGYDDFRPHSESDKEYWHGSADFHVGDNQNVSTYFSYNRSYEDLAGEIDSTDYYARRPVSDANYLANNSAINITSYFAGITDNYRISDHFSDQTTLFGSGRASDQPFAHGYTDANQFNWGARTALNYSARVGVVGISGTLGGMIQRSNLTSNGVFIIPAPPYPEIPSDQQNYAVNSYLFTEWTFLLPSDITVTVGGSLNKDAFVVQNMLVGGKLFDTTSAIKKPFGADFAPRISASKTFAKMVSVFGDISSGYTPPLLSDVVASNGAIDPYLKPEQAIQYEVGARGNFFDRRLTGELTFYDLDNTNKLITETVNTVTYTTNIGEQRNEGIEASLSYLVVESPDQFLSRVRPWVSYTLTDAKYVNFKSDNNNDSATVNYSGNAVARVPRNMVSAGIDAATDNGFYLNTTYQFIDRVPVTFDNSTWVRGFYLLSAKVGYKKLFRRHYLVDLSLGGDNLTSQTNYTFLFVGPTYKGLAQSQDGGSGDGYILPGVPTATVYGGVRLSYVF